MLWGGRRAPFTLLGGYLGAGKTTVVNHLVRHGGGRRLVVLVNDVGAVNVDADLIAEHDGATLSLTNGCVCCSIGDDLGRTLETIRELDEPPDHVLMELSGVAEPARVAPWAGTAGFRLDGIVIVADAEQLPEQLGREYVGDAVRAQLATADLVLLTKSDVGDPAAATDVIAATTLAPIVAASFGRVDPTIVFGLGAMVAPPAAAPGAPGAGHRTDVVDVGQPSVDELRSLVEGLGPDVVRAKGLVACRDADVAEVHVVGHRRTVRVRSDLSIDVAGRSLVVIRVAAPTPT